MIKITNKVLLFTVFLFMLTFSYTQVGIGTIAPEGILDLQNSNSEGFVFPKAALTASNVAAPVINPNGGILVEGTVVFNTSTTSTGSNDVSPGIYAWNGSQWNTQFLRQDSALFEQSPLDLRTVTGDTTYNTATSNWVDVPNLGSGSSFTAKYTGTYKIKTSVNFGAGKVILPGAGIIMMGTMEGLFRFTFNGTKYLLYTHSYSLYNAGLGGGTYYEQFIHDSSLTKYINLTAGQTYNFTLEIDIIVATHFENTGNSGNGRGHVGITMPCTVEFTYVE